MKLLALLPLLLFLSANLEGTWDLTLTTPHGQKMEAPVVIEQTGNTLTVTAYFNREGTKMQAVSFEENRLRFEIPTNHGTITCTLHPSENDPDTLSGLCAGGMGESITVMKRRKS